MGNILFGRLLKIDGVHTFVLVCALYIWSSYESVSYTHLHIGHVLTRVIKDMIPRFQTMKGHMVPRKAGWDTHGLPVELEVEKQLGLDGKEQIEEYGLERCV